MTPPSSSPPSISAQFDLQQPQAYRRWRDWKRAHYPAAFADLLVTKSQLKASIQRCNMAIYDDPQISASPQRFLDLGAELGLQAIDRNLSSNERGISEIKTLTEPAKQHYIPFSDRALSWHTDGYYNAVDKQINAFSLHCVTPASSGGENALIDHELVYCHLRDLDPRYITALSAPDTMTIPANVSDGKVIRPAQSGPVFSHHSSGALHMRYSARAKNIEWKPTTMVKEARLAITELLASSSPWILRGALAAGQGLISQNVLHNRRAFKQTAQSTRLLYRLRYYDRVN